MVLEGVRWVALSTSERNVLKATILSSPINYEDLAEALHITKSGFINKINGYTKFKIHEFQELMRILRLTQHELEVYSKIEIFNR